MGDGLRKKAERKSVGAYCNTPLQVSCLFCVEQFGRKRDRFIFLIVLLVKKNKSGIVPYCFSRKMNLSLLLRAFTPFPSR